MRGPIESRAIKVDLSMIEKREGNWTVDIVGSAGFVVDLPASMATVQLVFDRTLANMLAGIDLIRGELVVTPGPGREPVTR